MCVQMWRCGGVPNNPIIKIDAQPDFQKNEQAKNEVQVMVYLALRNKSLLHATLGVAAAKKHENDYFKDVENEQFELHYPYVFNGAHQHKQEFSEFYGHLFQVGLLVIYEEGTLKVYAFAKGVESNLVGKIGVMKLFMFIIWLEPQV
ncbi:hypothetical protein Tco_1497244 [Tanacetum coccineum]